MVQSEIGEHSSLTDKATISTKIATRKYVLIKAIL